MKKTVSAIAAFALIAVNSAYAIDLNDLGGDAATTTTASSGTVTSTGTATATTVASTGATSTSAKTIAKIQIIPEVPTLAADGKKVVPVAVRVSTENDESVSDVDLVAEIVWNDSAKSLGTFNTGAYSTEQKYFEFNYVAGTKAGDVQLKVTATSKANKTEISQVEKIVLTEDTAKASEAQNVTVTTTSANPEAVTEVATTATRTDTATSTGSVKEVVATGSINVVKTEVLDGNRIKVSFDKEVALSDNPLDMVSIESVKDKTKVALTNVTLGQDKKSLVIFAKDALKKEEYHVIVNTVVDGKTMKSVSVANGTTTVSWMAETFLAIIALVGAVAASIFRRRTV